MLLTPKTSLTSNGRPSSISSFQSENQIKQYRKEQQLLNQTGAVEFLEGYLELEGLSFENPHLALRDGVLLCQLLNKISPGTVKQISKATTPFSKMSNIYNFLNGAAKLGLEDGDLFETVDLYEGKDMARVYLTILTVARKLCQVSLPQRTSSSRDKSKSRPGSIIDDKLFANKAPATPGPTSTTPELNVPTSSRLVSESSTSAQLPSLTFSPPQSSESLTEILAPKEPANSTNFFNKLDSPLLSTKNPAFSHSVNIPGRTPSRRAVSQLSGLGVSPPVLTSHIPRSPQAPSIVAHPDKPVSDKIKNLKLFFDSGVTQLDSKPTGSLFTKTLKSSRVEPLKSEKAIEPITAKSGIETLDVPPELPKIELEAAATPDIGLEEPSNSSRLTQPIVANQDFDGSTFEMELSDHSIDNSPVPTAEDRVQKPLHYRVGRGGIIEDLDLTIKKTDSVHSRKGDVLRLNNIDWGLDGDSDDDQDGFSTVNTEISKLTGHLFAQTGTMSSTTRSFLGTSFSSDSKSIKVDVTSIRKSHTRNYSEKPKLFERDSLSVSRPRAGSAGHDELTKDRLSLFFENSRLIAQYQLGDCIGKGQFGSVYKALNLQTGQIVAVKRIEVEGRTQDEINALMGEVDLLKSLSHVRIVNYEGYVQSSSFINIILEFVENGSLQQLLRSYGSFSETLVASYTYQILEGLMYLHDKKVVHCDLKAANILTTKNGKVKLTDFGVSLNLQVNDSDIGEIAAGTPYWMAPEVITLQGASTASDIWSLGCTIVELLTGKPPYHELNKHAALYRIVEDDCPPFPKNFSETLESFLRSCFKKNPCKRPNAEELSCHSWIIESQLKTGAGSKAKFYNSEKICNELHETHITESLWESYYSNSNDPELASSALTTTNQLAEQRSVIAPDHNFIKSVFEKPITCKVCHKLAKEQAMLCLDCKIICHVNCTADATMPCHVDNDELVSPPPQSTQKWLDKKLGLSGRPTDSSTGRRPLYSDGAFNASKKDLAMAPTPSSSTLPWSSQKKTLNRKKKNNEDCCIS